MNDEAWMRLALDTAKAAVDEVPVGAVLVYEGRAIARAHNEQVKRGDALAHAEMLVIRQGMEALGAAKLKDCDLYVTLEPCPMCAGAIILSGIKRCVFSAFDTQYGCCGSVYALPMDPVFNHQVRLEGGLMEKESKAMLDAFFQSLRMKKD